jgi:hypothetical protein
MKEALKNTPAEAFPAPPPNTADKPILRGSTGGTITLTVNKITGRLVSSSTPENLIVERTFIQPHNILHYVNKDDPRGPAPTNPTDDPQYQIWENAIQDWIKRRKETDPTWNISFEEPPTQYDDEYSIELIPTLEVLYPTPSSTLTSRQISTNIKVGAKRGVTKVTYKLDDQYVAVEQQFPFNLNYYARDIENGPDTLLGVAEDDSGDRMEQSIPFILNANEEPAGAFWATKQNVVSMADFPHVFFLTPFKMDQVKNLKIFAERGLEKNLITQISDFSNLFNNQIIITWDTPPNTGEWILVAKIELKSGETRESDRMVVLIQ